MTRCTVALALVGVVCGAACKGGHRKPALGTSVPATSDGRGDATSGAVASSEAASSPAGGNTSSGNFTHNASSDDRSGGPSSTPATTNGSGVRSSDEPATSHSDGGSAANVDGAAPPSWDASAGFFECITDEDCEIASDCCVCQAVPRGGEFRACRLACESNACDLQGVAAVAHCNLGRCTLALHCDQRRATCESEPPTCPTGEAPIVDDNGCWGPCVDSTECADVTDCNACGDAQCVEFPSVGGTTIRCIEPQPECEVGNLCECLAPCGGYVCGESEEGKLGCACLGC